MKKQDSINVFRIINKFALINEQVVCTNALDLSIQNIKESRGAAKVGALYAFRGYVVEKHGEAVAEAVFAQLADLNRIPKYDLSTYEGFLEAFVAEMSSGAAFGGAMSGAGSNSTINATGMAGIDNPLGSKKRKIDKILTRTL